MLAQANCRELPLAANSVDLIFTDPPYLREFLPCYGWLAQEAARVLKPGGFVLAMCGVYHKNVIMPMFEAAGMDYFWDFAYFTDGDAPYIWPRRIVANAKSILGYSMGPSMPRLNSVHGSFSGGSKSKLYHHWGQETVSAQYFIDCFSKPGDLVLDPFIGGGTTAVACELIGRRCVGFDLDPAALATSRDRLAQADILHTLPMFAQVTA